VEKELSHKRRQVETPPNVEEPDPLHIAHNDTNNKDGLIRHLKKSLAEEREKSARYHLHYKHVRKKLDVLTEALERKQGKDRKKLTSP
jgi:hypothetical protein